MHDPALAALARHALVVTPNKRLARDLVARFDAAQVAAGRSAWPAARALPWQAFVADLWQQALDAGLDLPPRRLDAAQAAHSWRGIVAEGLAADPLIDAGAAAGLAAEAWERVHAYGEGGRSWLGFDASGPECEAFVHWASAFERATAKLGALDLARAPDAIARVAPQLPGVASLDVALAGFVETSPQQRRLLDALVHAGARVARLEAQGPREVQRGRVFAAASPRDELVAALAWARAIAAADPQARVGLVIHDLAQRRAEVRALAEDVLCPGLQWPGREREPRPYDISAGGALADVPIVAAALDLVALAHAPLPAARAAALLRSRFLPGDDRARAARALAERRWLEQGRAAFTLPALAQAVAPYDPALAERWRKAQRFTVPHKAAPRDYADAWRGWLEALGWCADATLDDAERAARGAWHEVLAAVVRLTAVAPRLARDEALRALFELAQAQDFEPRAGGARIRILGVLEAAGLAFDACWVAGLSAEAWPRAPQPNPLLPIGWQRERDVPRATAARELAYARALTAWLDGAAPAVVFSYAARVDDHEGRPSPLVAHLPRYEAPIVRPASPAAAMFDGGAALERVADARAPAWADGAPFAGGTALIDDQSACPFRAAARHRLGVEPWPGPFAGLRATERGRFVHAAFAAFWRDVRDHAGLAALDAATLAAKVEAAVAQGRAAVHPAAWDALPPVVAAVEVEHVARLMTGWLDVVERARPPFTVVATEAKVALALAGHPMELRVDRIDRLGDGRHAVIDYKTGVAVAPVHWFAARPQAPQLALYEMALAAQAQDVAALAFAQLRAGRLAVVGLADGPGAWPGLAQPADLAGAGLADWDAARTRLHAAMAALARAAHEGDVRIDPREANVCRYCGLAPLCRIVACDEEGDEVDGDA